MLRELAAGVRDGMRGAVYLARHRALWKYVIAPAVVVAIVGVATLGWLVALAGATGLVGWTSIAIGIATVAALIAGPFNEKLSEVIEERETGIAAPPFRAGRYAYEVAVAIVHAVRKGAAYVACVVGLLVLGHLVPHGPAIAAAGSAWVTARFASYDVYDAIWARRHWRYREKTAALRAERWRTLGLGAVVGAMLIVPGLNVVGLAIGTAGATLRVVRGTGGHGSRSANRPTTR